MPSDLAADTPEQAAFVSELARRYLWWEPVGAATHGFARSVAQIMNLGTYEDIRRLESRLGEAALIAVMRQAQAGWFSDRSWAFWRGRLAAETLPDRPPRGTFGDVVSATPPVDPVKLPFFGGLEFGRVGDPLRTAEDTLLVSSLDDLLATKLKATLDRAEAKDYGDIARLLEAGVSLSRALAGFRQMFKREPAEVLRALSYFGDGDLSSLPEADRAILRDACHRVRDLPEVVLAAGLLPAEPP